MTSTQWETLRHFRPGEFVAPEYMSYKLLVLLDSAREYAGVPFVINSSFRSVREFTDPQSHFLGYAVDIKAETSYTRWKIVTSCVRAGFERIGIYPRHVHVDVHPDYPQPVMWLGTYPSKDMINAKAEDESP